MYTELDGGEVHIERTDRHFQSVKYQNLLEKQFAEIPLFPRTGFSINSSMDDLTPLFSDTYRCHTDLFLTLVSQH